MQRIIPIALLFSFSFGPLVGAQDWNQHRESVLAQSSLIRYHLFDGVQFSQTSLNLAPSKDVENSNLVYKTQHPFEAVGGPFSEQGTVSPFPRAVRLDAGYFEGPKLGIDKTFTIEMRVRLLGTGTEKGVNNADNGTLYGLGNGWDSGIRLTTDCLRQSLMFCIGRPEEAKSRNAVGNQPVPYGVWQHIATTWDGNTMRIYVDGILYTILDYNSVLTEAGWGFRIGFNDAGVGSVKMDVAEVAVYKEALTPEEILAHALALPKLSAQHAALIHAAINAVLQKDFTEAAAKIDELLSLNMSSAYRFALRKFRADLAAMSGNLTQSLRLATSLLEEPDLPPSFAEGLLRRLIPTEYANPSPVAPSAVYKRIMDDPSFNLSNQQRFAIEKCFAGALFAEGKHTEAKLRFAGLSEREREYNHEDLAKQNLSAEFTELYNEYRKQSTMTQKPDESTVKGFTLKEMEAALPPSATFFVAPDGKTGNPGTETQPFGSLVQARDAIRQLKADGKFPKKAGRIDVVVRGGIYPVTETFLLESQDSGSVLDKVHILYRAAPGETPIFTGGVSASGFSKVGDPNILWRLPDESRDKVLVAQVPTDIVFPPVAPRGYGKNGLGASPQVELFVDDKPQQIARYPNAPRPGAADPLKESENSFLKTGKVYRGFFNTNTSSQPGIFEYSDLRHERWITAKDAMMFGYWGHLWGITSCNVEKIDPQTKQVVLATNNPYGYRENMPYYAFNLLEEIDVPGEWYLDRENNKLYVYPPEGVDLNAAKVRLSHFPKEFVYAKDASCVLLLGLHFEEGSGTALRISGGEISGIVGCSVKRFGNWGIGLSGLMHGVHGCNFVTLGGGGISLDGGNIRTLAPGNNVVENTFVNDFSRIDRCYAPAVSIDGVGNKVRYSLFCDSPGHAIRIGGMEHTIEFNEVHSIVYESDDQAGIDIWGNPYIRGMVFRYNYWHHIGSGRDVAGQAGIRLDDMISSVLMYGNVFFRANGGRFGGIQIHGGKDNIADGNLMIDCKYAMSFSPWGERRWLEQLDGETFGRRNLRAGFNPESEVYKAKYPDFAELKLNADRNFVTRNAAIGCDAFSNNGRRNVFQGNVMLPWMPSLFTETQGMKADSADRVPSDARKVRGRLSIPTDSPIYDLIGIVPLPIDEMGLYLDEIRKEIPKTEITPFYVPE